MVLYSLNKDFYNYKNQLTQKDYSIRLDETFYITNIKADIGSGKGYGYFNIVACDTMPFKINQAILDTLGYKNGQNY